MKALKYGKLLSTIAIGLILFGCDLDELKARFVAKKENEFPRVDARLLADAIHSLALSSRNAYAKNVVTPLSVQRNIIAASENWEAEHVLPLPAQLSRYTSELYADNAFGVTIQLQSLWPINPGNLPSIGEVRMGLEAVNTDPDKPYYRIDNSGGERILTAVYADRASSVSCIVCHNQHPNSPRHDFRGNDVLGGFVVRVALSKGESIYPPTTR